MNGYQKRLVHQLIRSDFPDIVSFSKNDFVQLLPYDQEREDALVDKKNFWFEQNLSTQIGLRWVAEALCPTVNDVLPPEYIAPNAMGNLAAVRGWNAPPVVMTDNDREAYNSRFDELLTQLSQKLTVLVGHK